MGAMQDGGVKTFDRRLFPLFSEQTGGLPAYWGRCFTLLPNQTFIFYEIYITFI
jgi:hypothetical protein